MPEAFFTKIVNFSKKHPFIFWGIILGDLIIPDFLPFVDELIASTIGIMVLFKKLDEGKK